MTAEEARELAKEVEAKKRVRKWNFLDALQLAWFEMWIKYHAKKGRRKMISFFCSRNLVHKALVEKKGYRVCKETAGFTAIYW